MPDLITGVLVLQPLKDQKLYRCWFQYTRSAGDAHASWILMREQGTDAPTGDHVWQFIRRSPWLDCSPSVRILMGDDQPDYFHNAGQWSNHYVQMAYPVGEGEKDADDIHYEINWPLPRTKEERDAVILPYRAQGILL